MTATTAMQLPDLDALDTTPKLLLHNAANWPNDLALREKELGIWHPYTWTDCRERVKALALGLHALGVERGDVVALVGPNRPHWLWGELAAHSLGAMSLGVYQDCLAHEAAYLLGHTGAKLALVEDEEQVDKLLEVADEHLPDLRWIVYHDPRGMRKYRDRRLVSAEELVERGRAVLRDAAPNLFEAEIAKGRGEDVAVLCTTSGTTANPKLAMLQHRRFLEHCAAYLRVDPRAATDEYVSILPLPWIMEQVYVAIMPLLCRIRVSFPEDETTVMQDMREVGPTHVLLAPRVWEQLAADVRARMMDSATVKRRLFDRALRRAQAALDRGGRAPLADWLFLRWLKDRLGFTNVKSAATGGSALGPDTFRFFLAMGVPLRQLYGQTEMAGAYTLQRDEDGLDFDSSGVPFDNTELRIEDPDPNGVGEILARHPNPFLGYFRNEEATREALTADGWMRTGDAGYIDERGRLVVLDRARDLATTRRGERFSPQFIENKLKFSPFIGEGVVLGNGRDFLSAILCVRYSMVSKWAEANGVPFTTYTTLAARPEVYDLIHREVEAVNASLPEPQRVRRFLLLYKELDPDDGELTRTRKVRRGVIDERYRPLIEAIYAGAGRCAIEAEVTFEDGRKGRIKADMAIRDVDAGSGSEAERQAAE